MSIKPGLPNNPITDQYAIEKITPAHYLLLKELYTNAFGSDTSPDEIAKRFDTTLLGCSVIGFLATHKASGVPAAYYGVFPFEAILDGKIIQAAQSGDTMTHEEHRRKGFFVLLARLTYEECKKKGIKILIGQPNENSYHGLVNSLGWTHSDDVVRWDLKLKIRTIPLPKIARRLPALQKNYLSYAKLILRKKTVTTDSFQNYLQTDYAKVNRDSNYLAYKKTNDKFFIVIENITIWVRLTDIFWIGDFSNYEDITPLFIKKIRQLAFKLGYNTLSFNLNKSIPLPLALRCFKKNSSQASCFLYLDEQYKNVNFVLTAADSDTW